MISYQDAMITLSQCGLGMIILSEDGRILEISEEGDRLLHGEGTLAGKLLADVADVSLRGGRQKYVSITLNEEAMKQYGVTMSSIVSDLKAADATIPGGSTKEGSQEYSVSTRMNYKTMELLSEIPLTTSDNSIVYLGDVATVEYAQKSSSTYLPRKSLI